MKLEQSLNEARSRHWDQETQRIRGKSVLLVEGEDDVLLVESALSARRPTWATRVAMVAVGGRERVIECLQNRALPGGKPGSLPADVLGLVDRDLWTEEERAAQIAACRGALHVTTGWCIENLFFEPPVLEAIDGEAAPRVLAALEPHRERWVRAGAFWATVQRVRARLGELFEPIGWDYGAPPELDLGSAASLEAELREKLDLAGVGALLSPKDLAEKVVGELKARLVLDPALQWRTSVHGKVALQPLLVPEIERALGRRLDTDWRHGLGAALCRQPPLDDLLALLLR